RGPFEDQGDAAPAQRVAAGALTPPSFQLRRPVEQLAELKRPKLFASEEVALQAGDLTNCIKFPTQQEGNLMQFGPMEFTVLVWNLFHGRDFPPDPGLRTWRSRLLRFDERNETHVQVNRDLTAEFAQLLSGAA